jgi:ribosome biogenesis protein SSF1/2
MARRRTKKRTHLGANNGAKNTVHANSSGGRDPKSMVIRIGAGEVGASVSQLVKDVRSMMEPGTASRLKVMRRSFSLRKVCSRASQERRSNRLRDYTTMAGPLGVSHLMLFSKSTSGNTNLRLALTPRGPTLHFRVEKYSLCKDVLKALKHPKGGGKEYISPPLLVMNNFTSPPPADGEQPKVPKHLESLTTTIFQSLFPAISPQSTPLSSIRRVLLLNRELAKSSTSGKEEEGSYVINLRHYAIVTKRTGLPRTLRRINAAEKMMSEKNRKGLPNLGKLEDVADYLLDPSAASGGFTSGSDSEVETDAEIEVLETTTRKVVSRKQLDVNKIRPDSEQSRSKVEKRAVKLIELGPRMKLRLTKVEEGICGGKVMWHEFLSKTREEIQQMEQTWDVKRKEKEERKKIQRENVERKRKERGENPKENENEPEGEDEWDSEDLENYEGEDDDDDDPMDVDDGGVALEEDEDEA